MVGCVTVRSLAWLPDAGTTDGFKNGRHGMAVCVGPCAAAFLLVRLLLQKRGAGRGKSHILAATILTAWAQSGW